MRKLCRPGRNFRGFRSNRRRRRRQWKFVGQGLRLSRLQTLDRGPEFHDQPAGIR